MREKKFKETERIAETIRALAVPGMKPKELIEAVKESHPSASRKDIARAAFLTVIMSSDYDQEDTLTLHDLASEARDSDAGMGNS